MQVKACGLSDVGRSRSHNEDCFGIDAERNVFIVADGMGGHGHGEVASRLAVAAIRETMRQPPAIDFNGLETTPEGLRPNSLLLRSAIDTANRQVVKAMEDNQALNGMGTTVVSFLYDGGVATVAHVGDSRAYRMRGGEFERVTQDHTWVNEQVAAGHLSEDQARSHPLKSVVTRAIGGDGEVQVDIRELDVRPGDLYLLCTDGLTTMLDDEEIGSTLRSDGSLEELCARLVDAANGRGGLDNVTVVLLAVSEEGNEEETDHLAGGTTKILPQLRQDPETTS